MLLCQGTILCRWAAAFYEQEYMPLFKGGGRLLTKMETIIKNTYLQQVIMKLCEIFMCLILNRMV